MSNTNINSTKVASISGYKFKEELRNIYNVIDSADWHSLTVYISNILKLPVDHHLSDYNLSLLENTIASQLGHSTLGEFITKSKNENGLEIDWPRWEEYVLAARYKSEFGINTTDIKDVLAQVDDVKLVIGRFPISKNEFNYGKSLIEDENIKTMEADHKAEMDSMSKSMAEVMKQLDRERNERFKIVEKLEHTLQELEDLKESQSLEDDNHNLIMSDYVKRSMYEEIVRQMEDAEMKFEGCTQEYLEKIIRLEQNEVALRHTLESIKSKHARAIEKMKNQAGHLVNNESARAEIIQLKQKLAETLKGYIREKKQNKKLHIISDKQKVILQHYKSINGQDPEAKSYKGLVSASLLSMLITSSVMISCAIYLGII